MIETTARAPELVTEMRKRLDEAEQRLKDGSPTSEQALMMESTLERICSDPLWVLPGHMDITRGRFTRNVRNATDESRIIGMTPPGRSPE